MSKRSIDLTNGIPSIVYANLGAVPPVVMTLSRGMDSWIVGSGAKFLCGLRASKPRDWDVIVPLNRWMDACNVIPKGSRTNTFGGVKMISAGAEVDMWASDLGHFFATATGGFDLLAVSLRTHQVCVCNKR